MGLRVKNWTKFQHYKDRCPPWIKLATDTFQNYDFSRLSDGSKLLAICCWTIASRSKDGSVPDDFVYIKAVGCLGDMVKEKHLAELISKGFLERSNLLASCGQNACSETEGETETETEERRGECAEVADDSPPEPAILTFPCSGSGPKEWHLVQSAVDAWADTWPAVAIVPEAKKALAWIYANPKKKKTFSRMPAFLTGWFGRTQDRGGTTNARPGVNGSVPRTKGEATVSALTDWLEAKGEAR